MLFNGVVYDEVDNNLDVCDGCVFDKALACPSTLGVYNCTNTTLQASSFVPEVLIVDGVFYITEERSDNLCIGCALFDTVCSIECDNKILIELPLKRGE